MKKSNLINAIISSLGAFICIGFLAFLNSEIEGSIWLIPPFGASMVLEGKLILLFRDKKVVLKKNDCYIVPKGVEHKPIAEEEVSIMLFEPISTINTGETENERTVKDLERI